MFVQTLNTPNPNSLKFLPGEKVSLSGPVEFTNKNETSNELIRNILSIDGVIGIFLSDDFLSINKKPEKDWEDIKHIVISFINEFYSEGNKHVYENLSSIKPTQKRRSSLPIILWKFPPPLGENFSIPMFPEF